MPSFNSLESGMEIWKPVIAAVNGYCLGFALTLVSACDFVIASEQAQFGFPEVRIGIPTIQGAVRMPARIGWQNAMELLLTGDEAHHLVRAMRIEVGEQVELINGQGELAQAEVTSTSKREVHLKVLSLQEEGVDEGFSYSSTGVSRYQCSSMRALNRISLIWTTCCFFLASLI